MSLSMPVAAAIRSRHWTTAHRLRVVVVASMAACFILYLAYHGQTYYLLAIEARPLSPLHAELRSGGSLGIKLGMLGVGMFGFLFLYPLRKRWKWLAQFGSTRRWLDFHVIAGVTAPLVISFHSSFKFQGLAGVAYWIMIAVALSGFVGRYVYAQIPRSFHSAKMSMTELQEQTSELARRLHEQMLFREADLAPLLHVPAAESVRGMSLLALLWAMVRMDVSRPFHVSRLRRHALSGLRVVTSLGGLLKTNNPELELIVDAAGRQSRLLGRMAFLDRSERIFHLWHVVHRPFSLSFVGLVVVHVGLAVLLGYF